MATDDPPSNRVAALRGEGATISSDYNTLFGFQSAYSGATSGGHDRLADPLLADPGWWDFSLLPFSPCIDAGDNDAVPPDTADLDGDGETAEPLPRDLWGAERFVDDPASADVGHGTPPIADIGVYEFNYCGGDPPVITTQPASQAVCLGQTANFTVAANSASAMVYRWQRNGVDLVDGDGVSGAATAQLTITAVIVASGGAYRVRVANDCGFTISSAATLAVLAPPAILQSPQSREVCAGSDVALTVHVGGSAPLAYQWRRNGLPLADDGHFWGTATSVLGIRSARCSDSGTYDVRVTNACGQQFSATATLSVRICVPGDCDCSGDMSFGDFAALDGCMTGPEVELEPGCVCADMDHDDDADLADLALLQGAIAD